VPFMTPQENIAATPARNKRQRPQQIVSPEPAVPDSMDDDQDVLDGCDIGTTDQGAPVQAAADVALPAEEHSPSAMHTSKKPRIPTCSTPTPSKAAAAAVKLRQETLSVSIAAAVMVLVAAVAAAVLLPGLAPHREQVWVSVQETAAHTNAVYLQPLKLQALNSAGMAKIQIAAATAAAQQLLQSALQGQLGQSQAGSTTLGMADQQWAADVLTAIMPEGPQWDVFASDIASQLNTPAPQRTYKAPGVVLACGSAEDCGTAAAALTALPPKGKACSLSINSKDLQAAEDNAGQPAAALQALVAPFLRRCPAGLVVLKGAQALPPGAILALHNALSELGGFQHNGPVDGSKAAYVMLLQLQPAAVAAAAAAEDGATADAAIKQAFFKQLRTNLAAAAAADESADWGPVDRALSTLHRRIEFAAPVRLGPSSHAGLAEQLSASVDEGAVAAEEYETAEGVAAEYEAEYEVLEEAAPPA